MTTPGKTWHLRRLCDAQGRFKMLAVDQRPPITQLIASGRGIAREAVAFADMVAVKALLARELSGEATAVLLDPNYAYHAAIDALNPRTGLIVTLEDHRFVETPTGRTSSAIADWSVSKIKRLGADGVKVLAWYRPDADISVCAHQQRFVQEIGQSCREFDIPFIFELLVYPFTSAKHHTADYVEDPHKRPQLVIDSVREFSKVRYGVDLFKLESPVNAAALQPGDTAAQAWFNQLNEVVSGRPWVMLSAGANSADFERVLEAAYRAGANGYLAGRAIWWEAMRQFPDLAACSKGLRETGVTTMQRYNRLTDEGAKTWLRRTTPAAVSEEGQWARAYEAMP